MHDRDKEIALFHRAMEYLIRKSRIEPAGAELQSITLSFDESVFRKKESSAQERSHHEAHT